MAHEQFIPHPAVDGAVAHAPTVTSGEFLIRSTDLGLLRQGGTVADLLPAANPAPSGLGIVRLPLPAGKAFIDALGRLRAALGDTTGRRVTPNCQLQPWVSPGGGSGPYPAAAAGLDYGRALAGRPSTVVAFDSGALDLYGKYDSTGQVTVAPADTVPDGTTGPAWIRHGSFVASRITAASSTARVKVVKAFGPTGGIDDFTLANAIDAYLKANPKVAIVNLSCGTFADSAPLALATLVHSYPRILWVAAAGNLDTFSTGSTVLPAWPAAMPEVIGVGALDAAGNKTSFTDQRSTDVWAPGGAVFGVTGRGTLSDPVGTFTGYGTWSGTSFSAPFVAGRLTDFMGQFTALNPPPPGPALARAAMEYLYGRPLPPPPATAYIVVT